MATVVWRGDQQDYQWERTLTLAGTWLATETTTVTINGKDLVLTVGSGETTVTEIATALVAMVNGAALAGAESRSAIGTTYGEWNGITASNAAGVVTLKGDNSGEPHTYTESETSTSGTQTDASVQAPFGPNEFAAENVTGGSITPTNNDLVFENSVVDVKYALDQSSAGTWDNLFIKASFEGEIGLPRVHSASPQDYHEYRDREFQCNASNVVIGEGQGDGSDRLIINFGSVQTAILVLKTAASVEDDFYACRIRGTHASNTLEVSGGEVDVAAEGGQTATFATLTTSGAGKCRCSSGTTLTTVNAAGRSQLVIDTLAATADITTLTIEDSATVTIKGDNAITTVNLLSGTLDWQCSGTITTLNIGSAGILTTKNSTKDSTITNTTAAAGSTIDDKANHITWTNAIDVGDAGIEDMNWEFGKGVNIKPG